MKKKKIGAGLKSVPRGPKHSNKKIPKNPGISVLKIPGFWLTANPGIPLGPALDHMINIYGWIVNLNFNWQLLERHIACSPNLSCYLQTGIGLMESGMCSLKNEVGVSHHPTCHKLWDLKTTLSRQLRYKYGSLRMKITEKCGKCHFHFTPIWQTD